MIEQQSFLKRYSYIAVNFTAFLQATHTVVTVNVFFSIFCDCLSVRIRVCVCVCVYGESPGKTDHLKQTYWPQRHKALIKMSNDMHCLFYENWNV